METQYAVGDRVVTTGRDDSESRFFISGLTGVVRRISVDEDGPTYEIDFDPREDFEGIDRLQWVEPQEIEAAPREYKFKIGDRVRVRYDSPLRGVRSVGVIGYIDLDDPFLPYRVDFDDDFEWQGEDDLEAFELPSYSRGDVLIATDKISVPGVPEITIPAGSLGYVDRVFPPAVRILWEGQSEIWGFNVHDLPVYTLSKAGEEKRIASPLWDAVAALRVKANGRD